MSEGKHTPGPWTVSSLDVNEQRTVRGEHITICTCWHHCVVAIEKEMEANARLIAAAPDMLDALRRIAKAGYGLQGLIEDGAPDSEIAEYWSSQVDRYQSIARAAIAKAEGKDQ